jgi:hypothetical protein
MTPRKPITDTMVYFPGRKMDPFVRFAAKVRRQENGCWHFVSAKDKDGYSIFRFGDYSTGRAHRFAFEAFRFPIPEGLELDHLCRNTGCVNPFHLEAVTTRVNILRGSAPPAQNAKQTTCINGHQFSHVDKWGRRRCKICVRSRWEKWKFNHLQKAQ